MRTHLLHTVRMPTAVEPDTGVAANDATFEQPAPVAATSTGDSTPAPPVSREDDYALGGYAGI